MMENPDFRVDYGTITTGHMVNPAFDKPLVVISECSRHYYSVEVMQEMMMELGRGTCDAILGAVRKPLRRFNGISIATLRESDVPEDMSKEHITSHAMVFGRWNHRLHANRPSPANHRRNA